MNGNVLNACATVFVCWIAIALDVFIIIMMGKHFVVKDDVVVAILAFLVADNSFLVFAA